MAEPIIVPITTLVASSRVNLRGKVSTAGAAACGVIRASISAHEERWNLSRPTLRADIDSARSSNSTLYWIVIEPP